jgi:hypothetical protein
MGNELGEGPIQPGSTLALVENAFDASMNNIGDIANNKLGSVMSTGMLGMVGDILDVGPAKATDVVSDRLGGIKDEMAKMVTNSGTLMKEVTSALEEQTKVVKDHMAKIETGLKADLAVSVKLSEKVLFDAVTQYDAVHGGNILINAGETRGA